MPWLCPLLDVSHWSVPPGVCLFGENSMELDTKQPWFLLACSSCSSWPWFSFFLQLQVQVELNILKHSAVVWKNVNIYFRPLVSNMDPAAKPAWMRHQALQSCVCHQLRHLWITFSLCWNLPGHDSPWFAFVVWSKRFCQMVVCARHVTRCPLKITLISGWWQELSLSHDRRLLSRIDEHGRPLCP